jgi:ABC-type dipeptide/oligopeptide/nickel transport system permease subunit
MLERPAAASGSNGAPASLIEGPAHINEGRRIIRVLAGRKIVVVGFVIIFLTLLTAIFANWLAPYDPYEPNMEHSLEQPSWQHWLGTDSLGRDTLSRIIYGARTSMIIGVSAVAIAAFLGISLGLIAGYFGGLIESVVMRFIDAFMAFPMIMLTLVIAALLGQGIVNVIIALGIGMMVGYARLVCGQVLSVKENDYVLAEKSIGAGSLRIMVQHIFPNCLATLIVMMTMMLGSTILAEAGLSFLGIGINPPGAAWGAMVNNGYRYLLSNPILSFAPGIAIMLVVFAFNMVGDGLRDALDPRLRGTI